MPVTPETLAARSALAAAPPAAVYIVTGESDSVSGAIVSAHATEAGATAKAVSLVNVLLAELDLPADATPENLEARVELLEDETSGGSYVSVTAYDLET